MGQDFPVDPIAVYLHNPFCLSLCPYCSFYRLPWTRDAQKEYYELLLKELELWKKRIGRGIEARTIYFGGGTPSLLESQWISELCQRLGLEGKSSDVEVTLEINPIQVTESFFHGLSGTPVNRISLGVQSLNDEALGYLGRRHKGSQVPGAIRLLREHGFDNVSMDLMYGIPLMDVADLQRDLEGMLALEVEHISCYLLTLDEDSTLYAEIERGDSPPLPDSEECRKQYELIIQTLRDAGYHHYEISNFALPAYESKHNLSYWQMEPYLALGASASGWLPPLFYTNPNDLTEYKEQIQRGELMPDAEELDGAEQIETALMMGLRLLKGIDSQVFERRFGGWLTEERQAKIRALQRIGMIKWQDGRLCLSDEALFVSNSVIGELL